MTANPHRLWNQPRLRTRIAPFVAAIALGALPLTAIESGDLDPDFGGGDGVRKFSPVVSTTSLHVNDLAIAPDGQAWIAGSVIVGGDFDPYVCRVNAYGGAHACLVVPFDLVANGADFGKAVAVQPDGKIVVAGTAAGPAGDPEPRVVLFRVTPQLVLDATFGGDGRVDLPLSAEADVRDVAVTTDGRIVFAGTVTQMGLGIENQNFLVGRLLANGDWDTTFDADGRRIVLFDAGGDHADTAAAVAVSADGSVVVVGTAARDQGSSMAIARLTAAGIPDPSFDADGRLLIDMTMDTDFNGAHAVAIDRFGRIVIAGKIQTPAGVPDFVGLVRMGPTGVLDPTFDDDGKTELFVTGAAFLNSGAKMALLPGDRIAVAGDFSAGAPGDNKDNYVMVVDGSGQPDPSYGGGDGWVAFSTWPSVADAVTQMAGIVSDRGHLVVVGDTFSTEIGFVARLWGDVIFSDDFETGSSSAWGGK